MSPQLLQLSGGVLLLLFGILIEHLLHVGLLFWDCVWFGDRMDKAIKGGSVEVACEFGHDRSG